MFFLQRNLLNYEKGREGFHSAKLKTTHDLRDNNECNVCLSSFETFSCCFQVLVVVYLAVVVIMVRRQLRQVSRDEEEEEDRVVMTDKKGNTIIHKVESVVNNTKEVLM